LAAMVDYLNENVDHHIITIEDPIEFQHEHKKSTINQREVGVDVTSFSEAIRRALRQDPDVILVGEMRDLPTIEAAITAAETGHIVFATLHTSSAAGTINRIIDVFPTNQQEQIRTQ
jgi:twitching motility protein PilT